MRNPFGCQDRYLLYWIVTVCLSVANLSLLYHALFQGGVMSLSTRILCSAADSMLLFLPFVFARRRYLYLVPVWFAILSVLELGNLLYFRNFKDMISGASYFSSGSVNRFVIESAMGSLQPADSLFLLTTLASVYATVWAVRGGVCPTGRTICAYISAMAVLLAVQFGLSVRRISIFGNLGIREAFAEYGEGFRLRTTWKEYVMDYGFAGYLARVARDNMQTPYVVTDQDRADFRDFWTGYGRIAGMDSTLVSALDGNRDRNLILIIVESLNSKVFRLPDTDVIIPTLAGLAGDADILFFPDIVAMTGHGRSSDGQFMYNTGLLPLVSEALVGRYADACYPSLAKTLGCESVEVIGEAGSLWSHTVTSASYGYGRLMDETVPDGTPVALQDSMIFDRAAEAIGGLPGRFFMQITTLGMHKPYTRETGVSLPAVSGYGETDRHYLEAVHAFDRSLGRFLACLKASGVYDRSVIVIVSDHEEMYPMLGQLFNEKKIPMMIINSGITRSPIHAGQHRQIDVFPTILDAMGYTDRTIYRGVGRSMLRRCDSDTVPLPTLRDMSEKAIRSTEMLDTLRSIFSN